MTLLFSRVGMNGLLDAAITISLFIEKVVSPPSISSIEGRRVVIAGISAYALPISGDTVWTDASSFGGAPEKPPLPIPPQRTGFFFAGATPVSKQCLSQTLTVPARSCQDPSRQSGQETPWLLGHRTTGCSASGLRLQAASLVRIASLEFSRS